MNVGTAREAAKEWVLGIAAREAGFRGAYFSGSVAALSEEVLLPPASDIDIMVVTDRAEALPKLGKFLYRGALLEVSYVPLSQLASPEDVLADYHLAGGFRRDTVIADPTGHLHELYALVSDRFAELEWVRRRCGHARRRVEGGLSSLSPALPLHDLVTSWLFPTGVTTHVLLVAALRNPTIRLRYLAVRDVLTDYGRSAFYTELLGLLGCLHFTPQRTEHHLAELARTFDATASAAKTPFPFSSDITAPARSIAIGGSLELIRSGSHREAIFWIAATFARCHKILAADAPQEVQRLHLPAFEALLADLGLESPGAIMERAREAIAFLPRLDECTEAILAANPDITAKT
ncbi:MULTISPECIES: hypothetical protein [Paenibacillus]|uniref:hypothetical protein n=1 Tax=Paenibacillus TaxID=44249 RepID=UPI0022B92B6E|nr:hypothetical protein [Paenibacillus caseinilyticus]MCZ8521939.1 hypothetical protein [Paenibacillus caseinilyticus]